MSKKINLAIMQPYFFPYIGHFALIASVDEWIVFDLSQYSKRSWINRNRILHPNKEFQYISIPLLKSSQSLMINEARVANLNESLSYILGKLTIYKKTAPYYANVLKIVRKTFANASTDSLVQLNIESLKVCCEYIGIPFNYKIASNLELDLPSCMRPGEWAPRICEKLSATSYLNPISGKEIFQESDFTSRDLNLYFAENKKTFTFSTPGFEHQPNLSILDALMWNSAEVINEEITNMLNIKKYC